MNMTGQVLHVDDGMIGRSDMVDFRINWTLQVGAVGNSAYQTRVGSIYFWHSP